MVLAAPGRPDNAPVRTPDAPLRTAATNRALPSGRAVVGGLLVAIAILGVFVASRGASRRPVASFVVAAGVLAPGDVIDADDVALRPVALPASLAVRAFRQPSEVVGRAALAPLAEGELLQASAVGDPASAGGLAEVSFAIDADRALSGRLRPGESIDVVVTYGTGETAASEIVSRRAHVVRVDAGGGALGQADTVVLTLAVDDPDEAIRIAHAARSGEVTVVRTTAADGEG
jgi:Flp pilus assembly protein CpaB